MPASMLPFELLSFLASVFFLSNTNTVVMANVNICPYLIVVIRWASNTTKTENAISAGGMMSTAAMTAA